MGDPTNRNDPQYANDPHYVWSGGRWQYVSNPSTANQPAYSGHVSGDSLGTPGGFGDLATGLWDRIRGKPFASATPEHLSLIPNSAYWQAVAQRNAQRVQATNPYNAGIADQSRGAQLALLAQMRAMQQGPSLAALQTQRALAQSGQSALGAAAMGAPGRAAMMQAGQVGGGLAGDAGQARLAEVMRMQAAQGGLAGGLRGNDLNSAGYQVQAGLRAQDIADQNSRAYAQMGAGMQGAQDRMALENFKLLQRLKLAGQKTNQDAATEYAGLLASLWSHGALGGGGGGGGGGTPPAASGHSDGTSGSH